MAGEQGRKPGQGRYAQGLRDAVPRGRRGTNSNCSCGASRGAEDGATAPAATGQKTAKACIEEWRANKAANEAKGVTQKAYVADCRTGKTTAQPTLVPTTQPQQTRTTTAPPPAAQPPQQAPRTTTGAAPPAATAPTGANQYATEGQAKFRCVGGTVVWANLNSKIYHFSGNKTYGQTKAGAYMCERDAQGQGMRAAKNEKHP